MKWSRFINLKHLQLQLVVIYIHMSVTEHRLKLAAALLQNTWPKRVNKFPKQRINEQNYNKLKALFSFTSSLLLNRLTFPDVGLYNF